MATRLGSRGCATASSAPVKTSDASGSTKGEGEAAGEEKKKEEEETKTGWGMFFVYAVGWVSGLVFLYNFYKEDYNLHRTEIALVNSVRRLPLYYPAETSKAAENATIDGDGLPPELVLAFTEWFITLDLQQSEGVIRDDVLELFREMGFDDNAKVCKRYLERGEGHLEERRRMSGTGLQESVSLLADLAFHQKPEKLKEGEEPPVDPRTLIGSSAVEFLRKKGRGIAPIAASASALHALSQASAMQMPQASAPTVAPPMSTLSTSSGQEEQSKDSLSLNTHNNSFGGDTLADDDDEQDSEEMHQQLEDARLKRLEDGLMARLESRGSLSAAEEGRLRDIRGQRAALNTGGA